VEDRITQHHLVNEDRITQRHLVNEDRITQHHLVNGRLTDVLDVISCILALLGTVDFCLTSLFLQSYAE